jgi:hypothetical protein
MEASAINIISLKSSKEYLISGMDKMKVAYAGIREQVGLPKKDV